VIIWYARVLLFNWTLSTLFIGENVIRVTTGIVIKHVYRNWSRSVFRKRSVQKLGRRIWLNWLKWLMINNVDIVSLWIMLICFPSFGRIAWIKLEGAESLFAFAILLLLGAIIGMLYHNSYIMWCSHHSHIYSIRLFSFFKSILFFLSILISQIWIFGINQSRCRSTTNLLQWSALSWILISLEIHLIYRLGWISLLPARRLLLTLLICASIPNRYLYWWLFSNMLASMTDSSHLFRSSRSTAAGCIRLPYIMHRRLQV